MEISTCLTPSTIELDVKGSSKPEILKNLVDVFARNARFEDSSEVLAQLIERENLKTTGIGSGVAIPHCKTAAVDRAHIVVGLSRQGIDFQSLDKLPAHLFFLVVAPEEAGATHLKICAQIARLTKDASFREKLLEIQTPEEVVTFIKEKESDLS